MLLPLNDTQKYDLAVDKDRKIQKVSVKTTQCKNKADHYEVLLKNSGGSSGTSKIRHFDKTSCDILFILTIEGSMYEIPSSEIDCKNSLTLTNKWDMYKVSLDWGN